MSLNINQMDPPLEEQQSQQGVQRNPNENRTMRDHIHPPRVSAPSCIVPPTEDVNVRPYMVPLLPTFHGMENENPYTHIRDCEEVCMTMENGNAEIKSLPLNPEIQGQDLAQLSEAEDYKELGRYAGIIFEEILEQPLNK